MKQDRSIKTASERTNRHPVTEWADRYARHRAVPVLVNFALFLLFWICIAVPSRYGGEAFRAGHPVAGSMLLGSALLVCAVIVALSVTARGRRKQAEWIEAISQRYYGKEGRVVPQGTDKIQRRTMDYVVASLYGGAIMVSVLLGVRGYLPIDAMLPVSAIYAVPFLLYLCIRMRAPAIFYLWPVLYALHALLVVAGAPILFCDEWLGLNILVPVIGYGALTFFIAHLYSRYALHRLKACARAMPEGMANQTVLDKTVAGESENGMG